MGSALGLSSSVTQGIVSGVGRTVSETDPAGGTGRRSATWCRPRPRSTRATAGARWSTWRARSPASLTLAATDPALGEGQAPGIGFAIPVSMVRTVADQIIRTGRVTDSGRAALGITGRTVLDDDYTPSGVAVVEVVAGGAAEEAGLRAGDVITRVGNEEITTITSLAEALAPRQPGDKVTVTYERGGSRRTAEVTLGEL